LKTGKHQEQKQQSGGVVGSDLINKFSACRFAGCVGSCCHESATHFEGRGAGRG